MLILLNINIPNAYGSSNLYVYLIPIASSFLLYICNIPISTMKYGKNGDIVLVIESATLNIACANSGEIFCLINSGTIEGAKTDHLSTADVWKIFTNATSIKNAIISGKPVNSIFSNISIILIVNTSPILVFLNNAIN